MRQQIAKGTGKISIRNRVSNIQIGNPVPNFDAVAVAAPKQLSLSDRHHFSDSPRKPRCAKDRSLIQPILHRPSVRLFGSDPRSMITMSSEAIREKIMEPSEQPKAPEYFTLAHATIVVERLTGKLFNVRTLRSWRSKGRRGKKLKTCKIGNEFHTTEAWIKEFFDSDDYVSTESLEVKTHAADQPPRVPMSKVTEEKLRRHRIID